MITILNQSKTEIQNCINIRIEGCDVCSYETLGTYATEERAKEVLMEIAKEIFDKWHYYEMPKE